MFKYTHPLSSAIRAVRKPQACYLPSVKGPCEALLTRWHYDAERQACHTFIYGGCEGNANNFETLMQCQQKCKGEMSDFIGAKHIRYNIYKIKCITAYNMQQG